MTKVADELKELYQNKPFNFGMAAGNGKVLFAGEGNLSFSLSLASSRRIAASRIVATTFEGSRQASRAAKENGAKLSTLGATVRYGVDAQRIKDTLGPEIFDLIVFQFPNVGSRNPKYRRNPNAILTRRFMASALGQLRANGKIAITVVDSSHYHGAFDLLGGAKFAGLEVRAIYPFKPSMFKGYTHERTLEDRSGLSNHRTFKTWVFCKSGYS